MSMMTMTAIRLIAMREIKARWALLPGALVFGILAMMVTRTLDVDEGGPADMVTITRVVAFLAAGMIGLSLLGDQLTDGRLSFYFTRPFTPRTIFAGKLVGGLALAVAIYVCLVMPGVLGFPAEPPADVVIATKALYADPRLAITAPEIMMGVASCVLVGMAAGIVVRSRTRWLLLDVFGVGTILVMIAYAALHVGGTTREALSDGTHGRYPASYAVVVSYLSRVSTLLMVAMIVLLGALVYATARALSRGRIDREVAHAALSKTLWPILVPMGAAAVAIVMWL